MTKNVTIKLDKALLKLCKIKAVESDKSLSQWIADMLKEIVSKQKEIIKTREHAFKMMDKGFPLGGKRIPRDQLYER